MIKNVARPVIDLKMEGQERGVETTKVCLPQNCQASESTGNLTVMISHRRMKSSLKYDRGKNGRGIIRASAGESGKVSRAPSPLSVKSVECLGHFS